MVVVLQSLCQLYLTYTKELAHVLIGNSQNLVFMSSTDMELVKMVSDRCGTMIDPYTNEKRELLSPDRLTHLNKKNGETLMLLDRHYPYITSLPDLSQYKMIQPIKKVNFESREKLEVENGVFSKLIADIQERKLKGLMQENEAKKREVMSRLQMTKKKMMELPKELRTVLDEVICNG